MRNIIFITILLVVLASCQKEKSENMIDEYKTEIIKVEEAFAKLAKEKGVKTAFIKYASEEAVLLRGKKIIKGMYAIGNYFDNQTISDVNLEWKPDFVDVSSSGDLAYTYGKYKFTAKDENGKIIEDEGIFHTVWKRDAEGKWKFVWD